MTTLFNSYSRVRATCAREIWRSITIIEQTNSSTQLLPNDAEIGPAIRVNLPLTNADLDHTQIGPRHVL
jgi:hypothetical protein